MSYGGLCRHERSESLRSACGTRSRRYDTVATRCRWRFRGASPRHRFRRDNRGSGTGDARGTRAGRSISWQPGRSIRGTDRLRGWWRPRGHDADRSAKCSPREGAVSAGPAQMAGAGRRPDAVAGKHPQPRAVYGCCDRGVGARCESSPDPNGGGCTVWAHPQPRSGVCDRGQLHECVVLRRNRLDAGRNLRSEQSCSPEPRAGGRHPVHVGQRDDQRHDQRRRAQLAATDV